MGVLFAVLMFPMLIFSGVIGFYFVNLIINKIGLTRIAPKLQVKAYGLLWIPLFGSWFEATMVSKLLGKGIGIRIFYFLMSFSVYVMFITNFFVMDLTADDSYLPMQIWLIYAFVISLIKGLVRSFAMKRRSFHMMGAICINLFLPSFWTYFMKDNSLSVAVEEKAY